MNGQAPQMRRRHRCNEWSGTPNEEEAQVSDHFKSHLKWPNTQWPKWPNALSGIFKGCLTMSGQT